MKTIILLISSSLGVALRSQVVFYILFFTFTFFFFSIAAELCGDESSFIFAQESKIAKKGIIKTTNHNSPNVPQAPADTVSIKNSSGVVLLTVTDENTGGGSIKLNNIGALSPAIDKLYNNGGSLYWNGNALTSESGGATEINELSDAKYDGGSVFIGAGSGTNDNGGNHNTAIGKDALISNISGIHNTAIGSSALRNNTTGNANTALGINTLASSATADSNSAFGWQALRFNSSGTLNVAGGSKSLWKNTSGSNNTAFGESALYSNSTGNTNTASGRESLNSNTIGNSNTAVGNKALFDNTTGTSNTANGISALNNNTTGSYNTAVGYLSLWSNTTASYNTSTGSLSLGGNSEGNGNVACGATSLNLNTSGDMNTAFGAYALTYNTTGNYNVSIGHYTCYENLSGSRNTVLGASAGGYNNGNGMNGSGNIFLGASAGLQAHLDDELYVDNTDTIAPLIWGDFANDNLRINGDFLVTGSMAVGPITTAPGANCIALGSYVTTNDKSGSIMFGDNSPTSIVLAASSDNRMTMRFNEGYRIFSKSDLSSGVFMDHGGNSWGSMSDSTKKENFKSVDGKDLLNKISKFNLTTWNYKTQDQTKFRHYGPMAQDFYAAFGNDGVGTIGNDTIIASADFDGIIFIAIQELEKRTNEQDEKIKLEDERIEMQDARIKELEKDNNSIKNLNTKIKNQSLKISTYNQRLKKTIAKKISLENSIADLKVVIDKLQKLPHQNKLASK